MKLYEAPATAAAATKLKERHIVTWTQQEDDILREQITTHGTENWTAIASKFKDKTTRQCRRRWFTYLNSDFKKGGWSPEEDMILCEAQKIFGNRWTEIAKVVSGRTDNAVKNRFSTLCKKRAKVEALSKENSDTGINQSNTRIIFENGLYTEGTSESARPLKKMRTHISDVAENCNIKGRLLGEHGTIENKQLRPPFAVLIQNSHNVGDLPSQKHMNSNTSRSSNDEGKKKDQGTFLKRDDPRIIALMQQAELLSSLAVKVNTENNNQSLDNAWKELQDFLNRNHENELLRYNTSETDFALEDFKDLVEDLKSSTIGSHLYWRQPNLQEASPGSSDYSTGSSFQSNTGENTEQFQAEVCSLHQIIGVDSQSPILVENPGIGCQDGFPGTSVHGVGPPLNQMEAENGRDAGSNDGFHFDPSVSDGDYATPTVEFIGSSAPGAAPSLNHMEAENGCENKFHIDPSAPQSEYTAPTAGFIGSSVPNFVPSSILMEAETGGDNEFHIDPSAPQVAYTAPDVGFTGISVPDVAQVVPVLASSDEPRGYDASALSNTAFTSPIRVTPVFQTFAATIPSPQFSESERNFLLKTLGSAAPAPNHSQPPPPCRRSLLRNL